MRRADFMLLTGLTASDLKTRSSRDQLPIYNVSGRGGEGWKEYTPFEAFMTVLAERLSQQGHALGAAAYIVLRADARLQERWEDITDGRKSDTFFLLARRDVSTREHPRSEYNEACHVGPLAEIGTVFANLGRSTLARAEIANASEAWRIVKERAECAGIDISDVFGDQ